MNRRKKFASLFLVFSLLALSGNLIGKEKRGAELIVQKKDGQQVKGELIAVKENSLLLLVSGVDLSVDIKDVKIITIERKSRIALGFLGGAAAGAFVAALVEETINGWGFAYLFYAPLGALIGGGVGALSGKDKSIKIREDLPQASKEMLLDSLRKKARIPDYE